MGTFLCSYQINALRWVRVTQALGCRLFLVGNPRNQRGYPSAESGMASLGRTPLPARSMIGVSVEVRMGFVEWTCMDGPKRGVRYFLELVDG